MLYLQTTLKNSLPLSIILTTNVEILTTNVILIITNVKLVITIVMKSPPDQ